VDGKRIADAAMAAAQAGNFVVAADGFAQAAQAMLASGDRAGAAASLSNLSMIKKLQGDLPGALQAIDQSLDLRASPKEAFVYGLMNRAAILDELDSKDAIMAWMEVATQYDDVTMAAFPLAHCTGATIKHHPHGRSIDKAKSVMAEAANATPSQRIGIVAAIGQSAGPIGNHFLAQAIVLMVRHMEAWNPSIAPFWELFVDRIGPGSDLALAMCSLGLILTSMKNGTPEHPVLMSRCAAVLDRVARARGVTIDTVLTMIERDPSLFTNIEAELRAIVPGDSWVV